MQSTRTMATASIHQCYRVLLTAAGRTGPERGAAADRDRGAVSLEQVLWFVAAGVSVVVIAAILWGKIRDEANTPVETPVKP